jgi:hypothetical protein
MTIGGAAKSSPTEGGQRKQPGQWQPWGIPGPFSLIWRGFLQVAKLFRWRRKPGSLGGSREKAAKMARLWV